MRKKLFLGWSNIKWFIRELRNLYSSKDSFFSKKRVESGIAFVVGQWGMIYFLTKNNATMSASDIVLWAGVEFAIAGYMVTQIQKEKTVKPELKNDLEKILLKKFTKFNRISFSVYLPLNCPSFCLIFRMSASTSPVG